MASHVAAFESGDELRFGVPPSAAPQDESKVYLDDDLDFVLLHRGALCKLHVPCDFNHLPYVDEMLNFVGPFVDNVFSELNALQSITQNQDTFTDTIHRRADHPTLASYVTSPSDTSDIRCPRQQSSTSDSSL